MFKRRVKSALIVDFDNVVRAGGGMVANIPHWVAWLEDGGFDPAGAKRTLISKKAYWNGHNDVHRAPFEAAGFEAEVCIARRKEKASSADFEITIDAMDLMFSRKDLDEVIILSFDTDFLSILTRLQAGKLDVVAMVSSDARTSVFRDRANFVISDADFRTACVYERPKRRWFWQRGTKPAAEKVRQERRAAPRARNEAPATPANPQTSSRAEAARRLARAAALNPGKPLPTRVALSLLRHMDGFARSGPDAYFGFQSLTAMLRGLTALEPKFHLIYVRGQPALLWRGPALGEAESGA